MKHLEPCYSTYGLQTSIQPEELVGRQTLRPARDLLNQSLHLTRSPEPAMRLGVWDVPPSDCGRQIPNAA